MGTGTEQREAAGGVGVVGLLGVLFVGLKLTGLISWPWIWVTAPFWGPIALLLVTILILGCCYFLTGGR